MIVAAVGLDNQARAATGILIGLQCGYGALVNFRATRGRHYGWTLMAAAAALALVGGAFSIR